MPRELSLGTMVGEYAIKKVLGQGGFGITYLANDESLDRDVAIKEYFPREFAHRESGRTVIPNHDGQDRADFDWGMKHFVEEARSLTRFKHKNIVGAIRFIRENGTAYLVMEYCEGESLESFAKRNGPLTPALLMPIVGQLLDGLEEVHRARLLHLDIKPSNIFLKRDGTVVLLDFGSARQSISSHTKSVKIASAGYGAIEQESADIDVGKLGPWTDVYGLGATLYRLMTGARPQQATARLLQDTMPVITSASDRVYSAGLIEAVTAALRVKPQERPQSIEAFRKILDRPDTASPAKPTNPWPPSARSSEKAGSIPWAALVGVFGLVLVPVLLSKNFLKQLTEDGSPPVESQVADDYDQQDIPLNVRRAFEGEVPLCPEPNETWVDCFADVIDSNGGRYRGMWEFDQRHGPGQLNLSNGDQYTGEFRQGEFHGAGVYLYADGRKFEGEFRRGKRDGSGIEYSSRGLIVRRGNWRNDAFQIEGSPLTSSVSETAPAAVKDLYLEITNNTGYKLLYVYVRPSGVSDLGPDRLGSEQVLEAGSSFKVILPISQGEYFDVIACDRDRDEYVMNRINALTSDAPLEYSHRTFNKCG